jgi:Holliday junction DNA helicase RuvA
MTAFTNNRARLVCPLPFVREILSEIAGLKVEAKMISGIKGTLEAIGNNWIIVDVGGISFQVFVPTSTLSTLGVIGEQVKLYTHLAVREDNMSIYGFSSARELAVFQSLITVSGIGPKLGMAMLSAMEVEQLTMAVASGNAELLTSIPGIGPKTAGRIVLELKDKVGTGWMVTQNLEANQSNLEVLAALSSLGYSAAEANRAIATLPFSCNLGLEEKLKMTLKYLAGKE